MKHSSRWILAAVLAGSVGAGVAAPSIARSEDKPAVAAEADGYKVEFDLTEAEGVDPKVIEGLRAAFHDAYPKLVKRFQNPENPAPKTVPVIFKKGINVPAYASGGTLTFKTEWFQEHPDDLGVMTHELTHIVQGYRGRNNPGWLTEGIADYTRELYGPKHKSWSLPAKLTSQNKYTQSYRVVARFLIWLDEKKPGVVDELHRRMQTRRFTMDAFKELTGKDIDGLWQEAIESMNKPA